MAGSIPARMRRESRGASFWASLRASPWALLAALCLPFANASAEEMIFSRLGSDEGLSQGNVIAIQQDALGFIWIGTEDGLDRYDGYELRHIVRDRKDPRSLPNNWVAALAIDDKGRLFVGTDGGGVVWRDPKDGQFRAPLDVAGRPLLDPQARVRVLFFDSKHRLWVGTFGGGLILADLENGTSHLYRHDDANAASLSDDEVFDIAEDSDGSIWVGTQAGLDRLYPGTGLIESWSSQLAALTPGNDAPRVSALRIDDRGTLWIGTEAGLFRRDPTSGKLSVLRHTSAANSLPDDRVMSLLQDDEQRLWVGTSSGLALLDRRTDTFSVFRNDPADRSSLPDRHVMSLFQDASGLLWVGTKLGGIARWNPRSWSFGHRRFDGGDSNNITSFAEDSRGTLWMGTFGGGIAGVDRRTGGVKRYGRRAVDGPGIGDDNVMAVVTDRKDRVWIGTMREGVARLDPRQGAVVRFPHDPTNPASLGAPGVMSLLHDSHGNVWVGTFGGGVARIDGQNDTVLRYPTRREKPDGLSGDRATALAEDNAGLIWIGTDGGGLNVLDPTTGKFRHYLHSSDDPQSLSSNTVYAVHVDQQGRVWVGTRGGGLDRVIGAPLSPQGVKFENYSENEGLPNSSVYGIESDASGRLWLSTNRGIARFDPQNKEFRNFRRSHGLQGDEFNFGAHYRAPSGELFFGGTNGYNAFFPDRLRVNERPPPVVLTEVLKLNTPVDVGSTSDSLETLGLDHHDDVLTFRFAALDFTAPAENRYAYKLDGFDEEWINAGTNRTATYTNLDGGNYVFRVRAANSDGTWNEKGMSIALGVEPPPWETWWAYALYVAGFALILYAVWSAQQRKVVREATYKLRLQAEVDARTAELNVRNEQLEQVNKQLQEASVSDPLTGLGNRRALYDTVNAMLAVPKDGSPRPDTRFTLMLIDLDRLKPINDQCGHEAGDRVLVQIAEILRHVSRSTDRVIRWGGDEFVVLCRDADMSIAAALAERVRSAVAKQIFRVGDGAVARTSCSIGFAPYPFIPSAPERVGWEQSLALADAALYEAKRLRNYWVGWCGTSRATQLTQLTQEVEKDSFALEEGGYLEVRRRPSAGDDTVDNLRAFTGPGER